MAETWERRGIKMGAGRSTPRSRAWTDYDRAIGLDVVPKHPVPVPPAHEDTGRQFHGNYDGGVAARTSTTSPLTQLIESLSPQEMRMLLLALLQQRGGY